MIFIKLMKLLVEFSICFSVIPLKFSLLLWLFHFQLGHFIPYFTIRSIIYLLSAILFKNITRIEKIRFSFQITNFCQFQESLTGVSTIRAYGKEERFKFLNQSRVDKNMSAYHPAINANRWLAVRLEF